jgi:hypothetical protein
MITDPRFNFSHRKKNKSSVSMEWLSNKFADQTVSASRELLKAQLIAGQHTLDKERFVKIAKHHGWILQIPEHLLV